jgi:hypothetical protein
MKIAYLHGLDSNNLGPKNDWLKSISELVDPHINYREKNIYQTLKSQISIFNPNIIIGSSMGGYFAYEIAKELNIAAILFNPALHSRSYEPDMTGLGIGKYKPSMYFIFGQNDAVINPVNTLNIIENDGYGNENTTLLTHAHDTPLETFKKEITFYISKMQNS